MYVHMVPPSLPTVAAASLWPVDVEIDVRELYTILPGLLVYPITMALLWAWDTRVLPELQRQMILPYGARDLARMRRKWLLESHTMTPLTSSVTPTLDQILEEPNKCHFIGSYRNVRQYVCVGVRSLDHPSSDVVRETSALFTELLGVDAVVEKRVELHDPTELYE